MIYAYSDPELGYVDDSGLEDDPMTPPVHVLAEMYRSGMSTRDIGRDVGMDHGTVHKVLWSEGWTTGALADRYGVSRSCVHSAAVYKTWRHLP